MAEHPYINRSHCNACRRAAYAANPEKQRAASLAYHYANREREKARMRARYAANPGAWRTYRQDPKVREKLRATARAWYAATPEKKRATEKRYGRTVKGRFRTAKIHAKQRGISWDLTFAEYVDLVSPNACFYCEGALPVASGGLDRINPKDGYRLENVVPSCWSCNTKKGHVEVKIRKSA